MFDGVGKGPSNTPTALNGAAGDGYSTGALQKDAQDSATETKFGDIWNKINSKYGAKAEKPREIKKTLDKDDFMRIMITQMKNQDPTKPFNAEQMGTELAQFASVEQLHNMSQSLTKMSSPNQPLEKLAMTNLIGKTVTVDKDRFPHTEGTNEYLSYNLPKDAAIVTLTIVSETGETVYQKDMGQLKAGAQSISWDGKKTTTLPAKSGTYFMRVEAKDANGSPMEVSSQAKAHVIGVSFEGQEPVLLIGTPAQPEKIAMKSIVRIDAEVSAPQMSLVPGAIPMAQAVANQAGANGIEPIQPVGIGGKPNFISFKKGEGSENLDMDNLPPEAREAIAKFQMAQAGAGSPAAMSASEPGVVNAGNALPPQMMAPRPAPKMAQVAPQLPPVKAEGFPNGLQDDEMSAFVNKPATAPMGGVPASNPTGETILTKKPDFQNLAGGR